MRQVLTLRVKILLGLVLVTSAILFQDFFRTGKGPVPPPPSKPPVAKPSSKNAPLQSSLASLQSPVHLTPPVAPDQPWERDPFSADPRRLPAGAQGLQEPSFPPLKVSGIVWGPNGYKALVNDHVVRAGDKVEGTRIVRITPKGVVVEKEGQIRFIPLAQEGKFP